MPRAGPADVFGADPTPASRGLTPSTAVEKVDGGYVVSGQWPWSSGASSEWAYLGTIQLGRTASRRRRYVIIPMSELSIEDTWFVAGMKGTGSNTVVADRVFVPEHRYTSMPPASQGAKPTEHTGEALYRSAFIRSLALILVGPLLGLGRAALKLAIEKAPKRAVSYTQLATQRSPPRSSSSRRGGDDAGRRGPPHPTRRRRHRPWAARGEPMAYLTRARVRADTGWTAPRVREAITLILEPTARPASPTPAPCSASGATRTPAGATP